MNKIIASEYYPWLDLAIYYRANGTVEHYHYFQMFKAGYVAWETPPAPPSKRMILLADGSAVDSIDKIKKEC